MKLDFVRYKIACSLTNSLFLVRIIGQPLIDYVLTGIHKHGYDRKTTIVLIKSAVNNIDKVLNVYDSYIVIEVDLDHLELIDIHVSSTDLNRLGIVIKDVRNEFSDFDVKLID